MILKLSVKELRGLMASGSAPSECGAQHTATPAGDGGAHVTGRKLEGDEGLCDEMELERRRRMREEPAATPGMLRAMGLPTHCEEPVYADVPPMPGGFPEGVQHGDCTAAVFGRRFGEAFESWLDAFDCVLRSLPGGEKGRRMLDMESYALTDTDAVVRVYRLEGGLRCGGPFHEYRVHLKPRFVLGSGCGDYVDVVVSNEVDSLVRGLGVELGLDDSRMARVRALVALEERPPQSRGSHEACGAVPYGKADGDGKACVSERPEKIEKEEEVTEGDEVERLDAALWERLRVMADSVNGLLGLLGGTRSFVVNTLRGGDGDGKIVVCIQVRDEREDWVRRYWWSVGTGDVDVDGCVALADSLAQGWTLVVMRAVVCDDWTGWSERRPDGKCVRCDGSQRAETKDYEARDEEDAEESRREMAEAESEMAEDLGVRPAWAKIDGKRGDEADVQDYNFDDVEGYVGTPEGHELKERAAHGGKVVRDFLRRFGLFADWVEGENGRRLVAETTPSDDWRRMVVSVTDAGTGRLLHACDYELIGEDGARITWLTTMNLCLFCLGLCETVFQERMRAEHIDVFPELEGGFAFGGDSKRYNDGGRDGDVRKEYGRVRVVAETIRGWLDGLERWVCARMPDEVGGFKFRVFPFVDHEAGEAVRGGESVRLICRRCDTYTVFDVERHIPEGYGGMPMLRHLAVGMCAEMALALAGRLPWLDVAGFLRSEGGPDPEFDAEVLKVVGCPECDADADGKCGDKVGKRGDDEAGKKWKAFKLVRGPKSGYDATAHADCVYYATDKDQVIVNGETYVCSAFESDSLEMAHDAAEMMRAWLVDLDIWAMGRHMEHGCSNDYGLRFDVFPSAEDGDVAGVRLMCHDVDRSFGKPEEYAVYDRWRPIPDGADVTDFAVRACAEMASELSWHEQWMDIDGFLRRDGSRPFDSRVREALEDEDEDGDGEDEDE